jgi:hypothetical protein
MSPFLCSGSPSGCGQINSASLQQTRMNMPYGLLYDIQVTQTVADIKTHHRGQHVLIIGYERVSYCMPYFCLRC